MLVMCICHVYLYVATVLCKNNFIANVNKCTHLVGVELTILSLRICYGALLSEQVTGNRRYKNILLLYRLLYE